MLNLNNELVRFISEPSEFNYNTYVENALSDIYAIADLLASAQESKGAGITEKAQTWAPWMIQKLTNDLQDVMDLWRETKHFKELEEEQGLALMAETDTEALYGTKEPGGQPPSMWFLVYGKLAKRLTDDKAKKWYENNNLRSVSPFHKVA